MLELQPPRSTHVSSFARLAEKRLLRLCQLSGLVLDNFDIDMKTMLQGWKSANQHIQT